MRWHQLESLGGDEIIGLLERCGHLNGHEIKAWLRLTRRLLGMGIGRVAIATFEHLQMTCLIIVRVKVGDHEAIEGNGYGVRREIEELKKIERTMERRNVEEVGARKVVRPSKKSLKRLLSA